MRRSPLRNQIIVVLIAVAISVAYTRMQKSDEISVTERKAQAEAQTTNAVKAVIGQKAPQIQGCYENYLSQTPKMTQGKVALEWEIDPQGKPQKIRPVLNDFGDPKMSECISNIVGTLDFAGAAGGKKTTVSHAFFFKKTQNPKIN